MESLGNTPAVGFVGQQQLLEGVENWCTWSYKIKIILRAADLLSIVDGTVQPPSDGKAEEYEKWMNKDAKAQSILVTRISEKVLAQIVSCQTSKEIWNKLHTVFEQRGELSVHILQQKFFSMKFEEKETVTEFLGRFESLLCKLKNVKAEVSTSMAITKITSSLPSQYQHFVSAWESVPAEKRTMEELTARLLIEEQRATTCMQDSNESAALASRSSRKCFQCGKTGHIKRNCKNKVKSNICVYCKRSNHKSVDCWFKNSKNKGVKKNEPSEQGNAFPVSVLSSAFYSTSDSSLWIMDSGASEHMCSSVSMFTKYKELECPRPIIIGDGKVIKAVGTGIIQLEAYNGKEWISSTLNNVLHVPAIKINLFSASSAADRGYNMTIEKECCYLRKNNEEKVSAVAYRKNNVFIMKFRYNTDEKAYVGKSFDSLTEWHQKMCHQDIQQVKIMLNKCNIDFSADKHEELTCEPCLLGKTHKQQFPQSLNRAEQPGQILHMDLCGIMETTSLGGAKYYLLIKDDYTKYKQVYFLKNKYETNNKIKTFLKYVIKNLEYKVTTIRSDCGLEFTNKELKSLLDSLGIIHQTSVPYTPQQNGCIEREMRTVTEAARTILLSSGLDKSLWAEAVNTAVYVLNRTGKSRLNGVTPYELWYKKQAYNINNLKVFGSKVGVHIPDQRRKKWDSKAEIGYFVGYSETTKGFRIYFPHKNDVLVKREVTFIKGTFINVQKVCKNRQDQNSKPSVTITDSETEEMENDKQEIENDNKEVEEYHSFCEEEDRSQTPELEENLEIPMEGISSPEEERIMSAEDSEEEYSVDKAIEQEKPQEVTRKGRVTKKPSWLSEYDTNLLSIDTEPITLEDALNSEEKEEWEKAMNIELDTLKENNTWTEVNSIPSGNKVISSKWCFKVKQIGGEKVYKARLVARGFEQSDTDLEVYSPVAKLPTFRVFIAVANKLQLPVHQMDVVGAFLHGDIDEIVYLKLPNGKICKLNKSLYGLKSSPKCWNRKFDEFMTKENFNRSKNDYCLYYRKLNGCELYVLLFVDDILMFCSENKVLENFKTELHNNFKMKDLGLATSYLGIDIKQDKCRTIISQKTYLTKVLERFNMSNCKPISTPLDQNYKFDLLKREKSENPIIERKCRQLIGSLMYAVCGTRPDLCVSVYFLSRYQHCASVMLYKSLKRILRYIKGTLDFALVYSSTGTGMQGFVDADWAGDTQDRKSTTGYIFKVFNCSVVWCCKKQLSVSLSSTESEYIALSMAVTEACWLKNLLCDFNIVINDVIIYEDNQSVIKLVFNNGNNKRLKHLDIRYHFIIDKIKEKCMSLQYIKTEDNLADLLTKPLGKTLFEKFVKLLY